MIGPGSVVSMAVLFREVKRHQAMVKSMEQQQAASMAAGQMNQAQEEASRRANLQRMREQTKAQLGLSMGMSPAMMGGGMGAEDPTTAAYISRGAQMQLSHPAGLLKPGKDELLGLGMV
jgi:hypothetical protein